MRALEHPSRTRGGACHSHRAPLSMAVTSTSLRCEIISSRRRRASLLEAAAASSWSDSATRGRSRHSTCVRGIALVLLDRMLSCMYPTCFPHVSRMYPSMYPRTSLQMHVSSMYPAGILSFWIHSRYMLLSESYDESDSEREIPIGRYNVQLAGQCVRYINI